jgi:hypothetical protein
MNNAGYMRQLRAQRKSNNQCIACGEPVSRFVKCRPCRESANKLSKAHYDRTWKARKTASPCMRCGEPIGEARAPMCQNCREFLKPGFTVLLNNRAKNKQTKNANYYPFCRVNYGDQLLEAAATYIKVKREINERKRAIKRGC